MRGAGRSSGRRGSLRTDAHWQGLLDGDVVPAQLKQQVRHHYAVWRQAAERVRALDLSLGDSARERSTAVKRLETVPGVGPIVALTAIAVFAEVTALRVPSTLRATPGSSQVLFNQASATPTATSPSAARPSCAPCCARRHIMRAAPPIPCTRTSPGFAHGAVTRPRW